MCGIAGYTSLDPRRPLDAAPVRAMLDCLAHRGPDDEGTHVRDGVVLGHRRLSVIDVEGGHQPLFGATERTAIVANGEIYNYRALRRELEGLGHRFRTASDTEVAAHAYDAWGLDFADRLDGMFALAIWDGTRRRLVLARDRMGEKPLYHAIRDGALVFASELDAVLRWPGIDRRLSARALAEYLMLEYVPAPGTIIEGVSKLEPGTLLVAEHGKVEVRRFWQLQPRVAPDRLPYAEAVRELRARLERAVRSRLVSDVPLGIFLSGGIDSSTVAALAAREGALDTFAIGFEESSFDERRFARAVADRIGARHHEYVVRGDEMPDLVPRLGELLDEPLGDASILPTAVLSRFARQHVTVALGGDGGDELFAGYPMHQAHRVARLARAAPRAVHRVLDAGARRLPVSHTNFSFGFRVRSFLRGAASLPPDNHALWMSSFSPDEVTALLEPDILRAAGNSAGLDRFRDVWSRSDGAPSLARATHLDALTYLPNDILTKVDRASMAVALEVRAPFLAREVVEFAFSLPDRYRMRGLKGKRILRDAVRDLLPASVLTRPKKGFGIPVGRWLNGPLRDLLGDVLGADRLRADGIFRAEAVDRLIGEHAAGRADHRKPLWTLLVFELWRREHGVSATLEADSSPAARSA